MIYLLNLDVRAAWIMKMLYLLSRQQQGLHPELDLVRDAVNTCLDAPYEN